MFINGATQFAGMIKPVFKKENKLVKIRPLKAPPKNKHSCTFLYIASKLCQNRNPLIKPKILRHQSAKLNVQITSTCVIILINTTIKLHLHLSTFILGIQILQIQTYAQYSSTLLLSSNYTKFHFLPQMSVSTINNLLEAHLMLTHNPLSIFCS